MKQFNVIWYNDITNKFEPYDIIPYLVNTYFEKYIKPKPITFEEFKEYIKSQSMYHWWSKCEYEILLVDFPCKLKEEKWDIHKQVLMNLDYITNIVMEEIKNKSHERKNKTK